MDGLMVQGADGTTAEDVRSTMLSTVRLLVDEPAAVSVTVREHGQMLRIDVSVADGDVGRVLGAKGVTVRALRTIASIWSRKMNRLVEMNVHAGGGSR